MSEVDKGPILAVGAHLDDCMICAGGVLLQAARAGRRVVLVTAVSDFSTRLATRGQEQQTIDDLMALSEEYGFEHHLLGKPYHQVDASDMALKKRIAQIAADVQPTVALVHAKNDHWPDHSACAKLATDAVMFTHGLSNDPTQRYIPLVYAFFATPCQTYQFDADAFYDISDVMADYMHMILRIDAIANRKKAADLVRGKFQLGDGDTMQLSAHGLVRLAEALRCGDLAGCAFGMGFETIWGTRRGPALV